MMAMTSYCSERDEHGRHHHVNMIAAASNDNHTNCSNACNHTTNDKKQIGQAQDLLTTVDQSEILYYRFPVSESSARNSMGNGDSDERSCVEDDITTPPCDSPDNSYYALIGPGSQLSPSSSSSSTSSSSSKENDSELDRIISMSIVEEERQEREEKEGSNNGSSSCSGDAEVRRCSSSSSAIYIPDPNEKSVLSNVGNQSWINEDRKRNKRRKKRKNEGQEEEEEEEEEDDDFPSIQKVVEPQQPSESHSKQSATVTSSPTAAAAAAAATTPSYQCSYCDKCFPSQYYLRFHETSVHSKSKSFPCPRCDKIFTGEYYLRQHKRRMHSESRPHACSKCASSFGVKYDLVVHMRKERKKGLLCLMFVIFEHFKRNTPQLGESKIE